MAVTNISEFVTLRDCGPGDVVSIDKVVGHKGRGDRDRLYRVTLVKVKPILNGRVQIKYHNGWVYRPNSILKAEADGDQQVTRYREVPEIVTENRVIHSISEVQPMPQTVADLMAKVFPENHLIHSMVKLGGMEDHTFIEQPLIDFMSGDNPLL